jgi:CRISPR-associated endoribonuclease Cas6
MRIKLTLGPLERETVIPINYQYPLSSAIYRFLAAASPEYAAWLHDKGYLSPNGKPMKLFVFSKLNIPDLAQQHNTLILKGSSPCTLFISSPMLEDFVQNFVVGLFQHQQLVIASKDVVGRFQVEMVETLPAPNFVERVKHSGSVSVRFRCLSPIVVSTMEEYGGKLSVHYIRPGDARLAEGIRHNLIQKLATVEGRKPDDDKLEFKLDDEYVERRGGFDRITKLITIKEGEEQETRVKCFVAPFELAGSAELIECAYECGIGEKNSMGFGMIEELHAG